MSMTTKLNIIRDISGVPSYTLPQSNVCYTALLAANVEQHVVAPLDAPRYMVRIGISNGADVMVAVNDTAAIPGGAFSASDSELNIAQTYVEAGGTVSVISPTDDVIVSIAFYGVV